MSDGIGVSQIGGASSGSGHPPEHHELDGAPPHSSLEVEFAYFDNEHDNQAKPLRAPWAEWVTMLTTHQVRGEPANTNDSKWLNWHKRGPCIVLGEIEAGASHTNKAVRAVSAMGLDIEHATEEQIAELVTKLARWEWVLYSTHKHGAELANENPAKRNRIRVVLPLASAVPPTMHAQMWAALNALTGGINDKATKNVGRLFYLPSTFDPSKALALHNRGVLLTPGELRGATFQEASGTGAEPAADRLAATYEDHKRIRQLLRNVDAGYTTDSGIVLKPIATAILAGAPMAADGERHAATLAITMYLAEASKKAPLALEAVLHTFAPSVAAARAQNPKANTIEDVEKAWLGAVDKVAQWSEERRQAEVEKLQAEQVRVGGQGPKYDDQELEAIAEAAGVPHEGGNVAQALQQRWILQVSANAFYLLNHEGTYVGPYDALTARTAAVRLLARAPVLLNEPGPRSPRRRPIYELAEEYGRVVKNVVFDLALQRTRYSVDEDRVYEARPLRKNLAPKYDELLDQWLRVFAGPLYSKICDWMACAPDLNKLLCALYLSGPASAGKTIFVMGMSYLWDDAPAALDIVLSGFNEEIARNPFVLADEDIPKHGLRGMGITAQLRTLISTSNRTLTRKYMPPAAMRGAIRLVVAANNDRLLATKDSLSVQDVEALAQRFLYIQITQGAVDFLNAVPQETRDAWRQGGIAQHALWLQANRKVERGKRFWVEGDVSQMHRMIVLSSDWTSRVSELIVRVLMNPGRFAGQHEALIRWGDGRLLVSVQALTDAWGLYFQDTKTEPETAKIGAALRAISSDGHIQLRIQGKGRIRYRTINLDMLNAWIDEHGVGDKAIIEARVMGQPVAPEPETDELESVPANEEPM